MKSETNII